MKWYILVPVVIVGLIALVALVGVFVPRHHRATCRARFKAGAGAVFTAIADVEQHPTWRSGVESVRWVDPIDGKRSFVEESRQGPIRYVIESSEPPRWLVLRIADDKLPYGGTWTFALVSDGDGPNGDGTVLAITEDGFVKPPIFRTLARFVFGYHATMEQYLNALAKKMGETVTIERMP